MNSRKNKRRFFAVILASLLAMSASVCARAEMPSNVYFSCHTDRKLIALTFDDGPHPRYTPAILDVLDKYGIRATFFMVGENISLYSEVAKEVVARGHEIGNHTESHPPVRKRSDMELKEEILTAEKKIETLTGKKPTVFRPPEGLCPERIGRIAGGLGYTVILWTVDTRDWAATPSKQIVQNVTAKVKNGDILLFHDYVSYENTTIRAIEEIIPRLLKEGYTFVTVPELLEEEERYLQSRAVS